MLDNSIKIIKILYKSKLILAWQTAIVNDLKINCIELFVYIKNFPKINLKSFQKLFEFCQKIWYFNYSKKFNYKSFLIIVASKI
jgi:hypothetical protein